MKRSNLVSALGPFAAGLFLVYAVCGQVADLPGRSLDHPPRNEFDVIAGGTVSSKRVIGRGIDGSGLGIAGVRYSRRLFANRYAAFRYFADVQPLTIVSFPDTTPGTSRGKRRRVPAISLSVPGGLRTSLLPGRRFQPFLDLSTGLAYFTRRIPDERGTRFNYTASVAAGVELQLKRGRTVAFGYRFNHISNGGRGTFNPGFNTHDIFVGYRLKTW
ncbi:MAG: acyloxyacyl hydrolase [Pyrinomonadaceae bacterium]